MKVMVVVGHDDQVTKSLVLTKHRQAIECYESLSAKSAVYLPHVHL